MTKLFDQGIKRLSSPPKKLREYQFKKIKFQQDSSNSLLNQKHENHKKKKKSKIVSKRLRLEKDIRMLHEADQATLQVEVNFDYSHNTATRTPNSRTLDQHWSKGEIPT